MMVKRIFDFIASFFGLFILLPLFFVVAVVIKLTSTGPVFFLQQRVGKNERKFYIFKFRTMYTAKINNGELKITSKHDNRITKIGRILRKLKIDELPQLLNVLKGEMSLVGPRPEVPEYVEHYPKDKRKIIFSVLPGITDYASIDYSDESKLLDESVGNPHDLYIKEILPKKLLLAEKYVVEQTLLLDLKLIFMTICRVCGLK